MIPMTKCKVCGERPSDETDKFVAITVLTFLFLLGYQTYRYSWLLVILHDIVGIWPDVATLEVVNGLISIINIVSGILLLIFAVLSMPDESEEGDEEP